MVAAMAQDDELSLAVATFMPVEISFCALARPTLVLFSVCRATSALVLVRMLDLPSFLSGVRRFDAAMSWMIPHMRNR